MSEDGGGEGGDVGGDVGGDDNSSDGSTGYGSGSQYGGYSETGSLSSANNQASSYNYSNTGAPGSSPLPETWGRRDEINRQANVLEQAKSKQMPSTTPYGPSAPSSMMPAGSGQKPQTPEMKLPEPPKKEEEKPNKNMPGQGGVPPIKTAIPKYDNPYEVERNPFPFMPQMPVAGSGVKRSFYSAQAELLKTMLPYWNK